MAITELLSSMWVSRLSTRLSATGWKLAILRGLGDGEVAVVFKAAAPNAFTLPEVVVAFIARIKIGPFMQLLILYFIILQFLYT